MKIIKLLTYFKPFAKDGRVGKSFYKQNLTLINRLSRVDFFKGLLMKKTALHIGCVDAPIFSPDHSLHLQLELCCSSLDGLDVDAKGLEELKIHCAKPSSMFSDVSDIPNDKYYDFVLCPETLEHVPNVQLFLNEIDKINFKSIILTAPNAFMSFPSKRFNGSFFGINGSYTEIIHPDHNAWYSPYTLQNVVLKYTSWRVKEIGLLEKTSMVYILAEKKS